MEIQRHAAGFATITLAVITAFNAGALAQDAPEDVLVLDSSGFWRNFYVLKPPVVLKDGGELEPVSVDMARWLEHETPLPPDNWRTVDFDDASWSRSASITVRPVRVSRGHLGPKSPFVALECRRVKFTVTDPAKVKDLRLSLAYQGGAAVYLNGAEIARAHLPKNTPVTPDALAEPYPPEASAKPELRLRRLTDITVPAKLLRKGTNVLAVELHRSPYRPGEAGRTKGGYRMVLISWGSCGLFELTLKTSSADGIVPNVVRPEVFQVWNSDVNAADFDMDYGDPREPLRPVTLCGTRGGAFSGKVVVGSTEAIKGLRATVSDLAARGGPSIPASAVEVRYAAPRGGEYGTEERYPVTVTRFDALTEKPPEEVPVRTAKPGRRSRKVPGQPVPVFGAVRPVWITVNVPRDARPGDYRGTLTIRAQGVTPVKVPVELSVSAWTLPRPADFRTIVEFIQSPDTLAVEYKVPLWSDEHFRLIEKSLTLLGRVGNPSVYIPLICETNLGNAQSMVRWKKKPDGTYDYDFTVMERYLDLVEKYQGKPDVVCLIVWDIFLEGTWFKSQKRFISKTVRSDRNAQEGLGPRATGIDPETGKVVTVQLPQYSDGKSAALWKPLLDELLKRMKRRGLDKAMLLGLTTDSTPDEAVVVHFKGLLPGVPWLRQAHGRRDHLFGVPIDYASFVWRARFAVDPQTGRPQGWKLPKTWLHFPRARIDPFAMTTHRFLGEMNIAGTQRGVARLGADFWPVLKDRRGRLTGTLCAGRYPKSTWRNLNIVTVYLAPGGDGPVATARLEMVREGIQECEARIFIEGALTDEKLREELGDDLAARCQEVLDERTRAMLRAVSPLLLGTGLSSNATCPHCWWHRTPQLGAEWFVASSWQQRSKKLYDAAADVAKALGRK